jgi:cell division protein ZapA (FtsZ GTPase activity inhibitor)
MSTATNITIYIDDRPFSLKVKAEEEVMIRKVVDEVNDKLKNYKQTHKSRDKKDLLAMTLLTYAVETVKLRNTKTPEAVDNRLENLNELLDSALDN